MRTRFDEFAKQVLAAALADAGTVQTERETSAEPQTVDLWFAPNAGDPSVTRQLGALGLLARDAALIEPFHEPPSIDEVRACLAKQLSVHAEQMRTDAGTARLPALWILSAGRPRTVEAAFGLHPMRGAPHGFLSTVPALRLHLVVISALPRMRSTLLLRLLGAGRTVAGALEDLKALPAMAPERLVAAPLLVRYRIEVAMQPGKRTKEEEMIMNAQWVYDELITRTTAQGVAQGVAQGLGPLARLFERRLGRALIDDDRATLCDRLGRLGPERLGDVVLDLSAEDLARWLADPEAR